MARLLGLPLFSLLLTLTLAAFAQGQSLSAKPPTGSELSTKGIVTAKEDGKLTLRESGGGILQIVVTPQTKITGLCTSFVQVAVSDIVRVDGSSETASQVITASRVEVLFSSEATARTRAKPPNMLWNLFKNGGITVDLP